MQNEVVYVKNAENDCFIVGKIQSQTSDTATLVNMTIHGWLPLPEIFAQFHQQHWLSQVPQLTITSETRDSLIKQANRQYTDDDKINFVYTDQDIDEYGLKAVANKYKIGLLQPLTLLSDITELKQTPINLLNQDLDGSNCKKITHFYFANGKPRPTEYEEGYNSDLDPSDLQVKLKLSKNFNITAHGIGSGIYGIYQPTNKLREEAKKNGAGETVEVEFTLKQPFTIQTCDQAQAYQAVSKRLQQCSEKIALLTLQLKKKTTNQDSSYVREQAVLQWMIDNYTQVDTLAKQIKILFNSVGYNLDEIPKKIQNALVKFNKRAITKKNTKDNKVTLEATPMPINFFMEGEGFNGIVALNESKWNSFARGCILFVSGTDDHPDWHQKQKNSDRAMQQTYGYSSPNINQNDRGVKIDKNAKPAAKKKLTFSN